MSVRQTAVLAGLLVALAAFWFFFEGDGPSSGEIGKLPEMALPGFAPESVLKITIARPRDPTATAVVVSRADARSLWRLDAPVAAEGDQEAADEVLSTLKHLRRRSTLDEFDPAMLGLATPRLEVLLEGATTVRLALGDDDHTTRNVYARVGGEPEALLLDGYVRERLDRSADDLRRKKLLSLDRWKASKVVLEAPGEPPIALKKEGESWVVERDGEADLADRQKVESLLDALLDRHQGVRAKSFPAEEPAAVRDAAPALAVTVFAGEEQETLRVWSGVPSAPARPEPVEGFVRGFGGELAVAETATLLDRAFPDFERWRSKTLLPRLRESVRALELSRPGAPTATAVVARLERTGEAGWRFVAPATATADAQAVDELIDALKALEVVATPSRKIESAENFGLAEGQPEALDVSVETAKERHAFRLGKPAERGDGYYARREGRPAALEVVFPEAATLRAAWPSLRDRSVLAGIEPEDIVKIVIRRREKGERPYVRPGEGGWSTPDAKADGPGLDRLASDLAWMRARRILPPPAKLAPLGLEAPWLAAAIGLAGEGAAEVALALGKAAPEGDGFYGRLERDGGDLYIVVGRELVDALDKEHIVTAGTGTGTGTGTEDGKR